MSGAAQCSFIRFLAPFGIADTSKSRRNELCAKRRDQSLDRRIVAALWVVLFHFRPLLAEASPSVSSTLAPVLDAGAQGVDLFFILSGFVLTWNHLNRMGESWSTQVTETKGPRAALPADPEQAAIRRRARWITVRHPRRVDHGSRRRRP